ncbi:hypothetical protein H5410_040586, partial [Solanum commersonii]
FIVICALPSASMRSASLVGILLLCGTDWQSADCSFHRLFYPSPLGLRALEQRAECVPSANRQACFYDTPLLKILMLAILATCPSSSSTKSI